MTYNMYLDDVRDPTDKSKEWVIVRSLRQAIVYVQEHGFPTFVDFDYYLEDSGYRTGRDFAQWLIRHVDAYGNRLPKTFQFNAHSSDESMNEAIRYDINKYLETGKIELHEDRRVATTAPPIKSNYYKPAKKKKLFRG